MKFSFANASLLSPEVQIDAAARLEYATGFEDVASGLHKTVLEECLQRPSIIIYRNKKIIPELEYLKYTKN